MIKLGADADLVAFDPDLIEKATCTPAQYSQGIPHVLVNGVLVVREGSFVAGVYPGIGLRTK